MQFNKNDENYIYEVISRNIKKYRKLRWDTILIGIEIITVIILGLLSSSVPDQVFQVTINFICAMQFNTFRQEKRLGWQQLLSQIISDKQEVSLFVG